MCDKQDPRREELRNAGVFIIDGIEFIRKDALLEWAKERYTSLDITKRDMWDGGYNCAIKALIDKLNEM